MRGSRNLVRAARQYLEHLQTGSTSTAHRATGYHLATASSASLTTLEAQVQAFPWRSVRLALAAVGATALISSPRSSACAPARDAPRDAPSTTAPIDLTHAGIAVPKLQRTVVFVLGGPGSGKGTQCAKLVDEFKLVHLSAGDLLRAHMKSGTADGNMVADMIKEGKIVPSHVTISLLDKAMADSGRDTFLIDGFPRNEENRAGFEKQTQSEPAFILFFDCPEAEMERRLLGRNEGRTDDNIETIRKRFKVFLDSSIPVVNHYEKLGKLRRIRADRDQADIYADVRKLFAR